MKSKDDQIKESKFLVKCKKMATVAIPGGVSSLLSSVIYNGCEIYVVCKDGGNQANLIKHPECHQFPGLLS